jgi:hypothetical protein
MLKLLTPSVKVSVGGEDRPLSFGVAAHIAFYEATGRDLTDVIRKVGQEAVAAQKEGREAKGDVFPFRLQIAMLYAGLIGDTLDDNGNPTDRTLTIKDLMQLYPTPALIVPAIIKAGEALNKALEDAYNVNPQGAPVRPKRTKAPRATKSTGAEHGETSVSVSA